MERYLEIKIASSKPDTIGNLLKSEAGLTKRQISQAKFRPGGIQKNKKQCRVTETAQKGMCLESVWNQKRQILFCWKIGKIRNNRLGVHQIRVHQIRVHLIKVHQGKNWKFCMKIRIFLLSISLRGWLLIHQEATMQTACPIRLQLISEAKEK